MMIIIIWNKIKKVFKFKYFLIIIAMMLSSIILLIICFNKLANIINDEHTNNTNKIRYDLNVSINKYSITKKQDAYNYYNFLVSHIKPKELQKYDDLTAYYDIDFKNPNFKLTGNDFIEPMICYAYNNFITHHLFEKEFVVANGEPLSKNFIKKYKEGVLSHFTLKNQIDIMDFSAKSQTFHVREYVNIPNPTHDTEFYEIGLRELDFKYVIDKNGYVDDLVLTNESKMTHRGIELCIENDLISSIEDIIPYLAPGCNIYDYIDID